jgi:Secretion system C-terminal sorting domain/Carbohydrate binding domain
MKLNPIFQFALFLLLFLSETTIVFSQNFDGGFNFYMPPFDSTSQRFLPQFPAKIIGEADRVTSVGNKFMVGNEPIRFWGVNIIGGACFPDKTQAAGIAGRMRKMGINIVRLHDLENGYSEPDGCIFEWTVSTRRLKPTTLDRLEYFIAELKKNNIYVNMNLNTIRRYLKTDGVEGADTLSFNGGDYSKGVTLFDPYLETLQREYAQQLLTHVNPYTGLSLANDPVLALVELHNENTLYGAWKDNWLIQRVGNNGGKLTFQYDLNLNELFQTYLTQKYTTNTALNTAWQVPNMNTNELIQNGGFETGSIGNPWLFETLDASAVATITADNTTVHNGTYSARFNVTNVTSYDAHIRLRQSGFAFDNTQRYTLTFWAKTASNIDTLRIQLMQDYLPFQWFTSRDLSINSEWKQYTIQLTACIEARNVRLVFMPRNVGTLWIDDISLRQIAPIGLRTTENLASRNIERAMWWEKEKYSQKRIADMSEFYIGLQKKHFEEFRQYLRTALNVKASITGTNGFVGSADVMTQTNMDYLDDHKYWDLVEFKNGIWNTTDWWITNKPMLKTDNLPAISGALLGLGLNNKPYTISEYNYSAPNRYRAEIPATLLPYAALHGVDGIMFFTYNAYDRGLDWQNDFINSHLNIHRDNSLMSLFPSCALAFRNGFIKEDNDPIRLDFKTNDIYDASFCDNNGRWDQYVPHDKRWGLLRGMTTNSYGAISNTAPTFSNPNGNTLITATNETIFDPTKGMVTTNTSNFVSITGFLPDITNKIIGSLQLIEANQFGSLTWVSLSNKPLYESNKSLITLSSRQQNTDMVWGTYNTEFDKITLGEKWGKAPTLQQANTVKLRLNINADMIKLYPLSTTGSEGTSITILPTALNSKIFDITLNQEQYKTLWFGVESMVRVGLEDVFEPKFTCDIFPNPISNGFLNLNYEIPQSGQLHIQLYNLQGQQIKKITKTHHGSGKFIDKIEISELINGQYFVFLTFYSDKNSAEKIVLEKKVIVISN